MSGSGRCCRYADLARVIDDFTASLLNELGPTPKPIEEIRAFARRHGFPWRIVRSIGQDLGVVELRQLGKRRVTHWALPTVPDGASRRQRVDLESLTLVVGDGSYPPDQRRIAIERTSSEA
jgi:hypothetical protein